MFPESWSFFAYYKNGVRIYSNRLSYYDIHFFSRIITITSPPLFFFFRNFPPNFVEDFLKLHNKYRAIHNSPPLKIDDEVYTAFLLFPREIFFSQLALNLAWFRWNEISNTVRETVIVDFYYKSVTRFRFVADKFQRGWNVNRSEWNSRRIFHNR